MAEEKIPQTIDDRPELKYLERHVRDNLCAACEDNPETWKDLGMELLPVGDDTVTTLKAISVNSRGNIIKCCSSLFSLWLDRQPEATWKQLIQALTKIKLNNLAMKIEHNFMPSSAESTNIIVPHMQQADVTDNSVLSNSPKSNSEFFKEPITITNAYSTLIAQLNNIFKESDLSTLKTALIHQARTPGGIKLQKAFKDKIMAAKSSFDLLCLVDYFPSCNWLDTRLIGVLAHGSGSKSAINLIEAYKNYVFPKKIDDVLTSFLKQPKSKAYVAAVSMKLKMDPDKITVDDIVQYQWTVENVILDLGNQRLNIKHVRKGCLEVTYHLPFHCSFNAYKMSLHNCQKFYTIDLMQIEIGDHPLIYDPWLCDLIKISANEIFHPRHEELSHILLESIPMDDAVKLFSSQKILTDDDIDVLQFSPNDYLKRQLLLRHLLHLKLSVWAIICNILCDTKSMIHVGSQLMSVLKDKLPHMEYKQTLVSGKHMKTVNTLHGARTIKLGFVDDSTLFNKSQTHYPRKVSLLIRPFQHVKCIKPSEVDKEFQYVSGHILELLSHCHPKLLINWCENLLASELANDSPAYKLLMIQFSYFNEHEIKLLPPYTVYKLRKLRTSSAILKMMSMFWSWSNHSILTSLVEFSEIAAALLEEFDSRLYLNSSITKYPISSSLAPSMIPHNNNSFTVLTLKCNRKLQVTLQLVFDMQSMMIEKCEITQHALQLLAVQNSPLVLQWMISKYIVTVINVNVRRHQEYFATKGITEILIHPNIKHCINGNLKLLPIHEKADELFSAAGTGNAAETEKLVQSGVYVDPTDNIGGQTPLYVASERGHYKVVEVLITAGADVNLANRLGWTPLYVASDSGHDKVVEVLITAGADVNLADNWGWTPLYMASDRGHYKVVEVLITAGADVNLANKFGRTPVDAAISEHHHKVVDVLLKSAVNIDIDSKVKLKHFSKSRSASSSRYSSEYLSASSSRHASLGYSSASSSRHAYSSDSGYSSSSMSSGSTWSSRSTWSSSASGLTWSNIRSVGITDEPDIKEEESEVDIDVEDPSLQGKELKSTVATSSDENL